jgi:hypothetical protein
MIAKTQKQQIAIVSIPPEFGKNYKKGYIGFTYHNNLAICKGIARFTRWENMSDIYATHALIVTGENSCIEADASQNKVRSAHLHHYFDDRNCQIFFRKPKGLNDEIADRIVRVLEPEVGKKYDFRLIGIQLGAGTILGHLLNRLLKGKPEQLITEILNKPEKWICSELVAYGLDEQPEYRDRGILASPNATITPQELFEDQEIFEPWDKTEISNGHTHCS